MPDYKIQLTVTARKQLDKLPERTATILLTLINSLSKNPRPAGYKKLKGRDAYRVRKGDYRVIYELLDKILVVEVIAIGNRKDIYD